MSLNGGQGAVGASDIWSRPISNLNNDFKSVGLRNTTNSIETETMFHKIKLMNLASKNSSLKASNLIGGVADVP